MRWLPFAFCACTWGTYEPPSGSPPADVAPWIGNWSYTGTLTTQCQGMNSSPSGTVAIFDAIGDAGYTNDITMGFAACDVTWSVSNNVATLRPNQGCSSFPAPNGMMNMGGSWGSGTATLTGSTIAFQLDGNANNSCPGTISIKLTLTRM